MAIVTRSGKGNALTHTELDANFTHLAGDGTYPFPSTKGTTKQVLRMNSGATALEFATVDTDEVTEGSTNQYFTNARADARIAAANLQDLANTPTAPGASDNGKLLMWLNASSEFVLVSFDTTDLLPEGSTNLYYTDARAQAVSINELSEDTTPELSGNLVTAGNRITHASSGTVSMMDFTKTLFSEANHTVLSSVKSINLFLDSNGGDTGQAFRIYNNVDPDGTVTENTHIFKVAETGDVTVTGNLQVDGSQVDFTNLPTSDPAVAGRLWNDSGTVKISAG